MNHKKILFLLKVPPPNTGATFMNNSVFESEEINSCFYIEKIGISYSNSVKKLGRFQIKKIIIYFSIIIKLLSALTFKKISVIYFQPSINGVSYFRDLLLILIGKLFCKKFILHIHGKGIYNYSQKSRFHKWMYSLGFKNQYLIVLSESQKEDVAFLNPKKIFVVNNGIPLLIKDFNGHKIKTSSTIHFLFLSNLLKSKGVFDLLETANKLKNNNLSFCIDIIGSEGDISRKELVSKIKELQLNQHVYYHGGKYKSEKIHFFENADVFVFPTQNEAFGIVLLEAMQFELAIIATDEGAIPEIIEDKKSGYIYSKNEKTKLFDYMSFLIQHPDTCLQLGRRGREIYFEKFTNKSFEHNMISVFNSCLKEITHDTKQ